MITVATCGFDSNHKKPFCKTYNLTSDEYLALLVKTDAWFYLDGQKIKTRPNMLIIYPPGSLISYGRDESGYNDDWIHFSLSDNDVDIIKGLGIPLAKPLYPYDFMALTTIVELLSRSCHKSSEFTPRLIHHYMSIFLLSVKEQLNSVVSENAPKLYLEMSKLRTSIYNAPYENRSISDLSKSLFISVSRFQHLYKSYFDTTCQKDMINARLRLAKIYLSTTDMNIREIAISCGYENELHFMRQFKKYVGETPSSYRKSITTS